MTEREHTQSTPPSAEERHSWDTKAIADTLGAQAEAQLDPAHGRGARLRLGDPPSLDLELFPATQIVRLSAPDLSLSVVQESTPTLIPDGVIFEAPQRFLSISSTGDALLRIDRPKSVQTSPGALSSAEESMTQGPANDALLDDLAAPDEGSSQAPVTTKESKEQESRIHLAGRLGSDVRYRTTRNGKLVASFPIAITQDDGSVLWQDVLMFGDKAAKLRDGESPKRGQYTEVVGYVHQKEVKNKDGTTRTVEEVYAVVVKPR